MTLLAEGPPRNESRPGAVLLVSWSSRKRSSGTWKTPWALTIAAPTIEEGSVRERKRGDKEVKRKREREEIEREREREEIKKKRERRYFQSNVTIQFRMYNYNYLVFFGQFWLALMLPKSDPISELNFGFALDSN